MLEALQGPLDIHSHPVPGPLSHASGEHPKILSFSQSVRIPDKQVKQFSQLYWKYGSLDDKNKVNSWWMICLNTCWNHDFFYLLRWNINMIEHNNFVVSKTLLPLAQNTNLGLHTFPIQVSSFQKHFRH